MHENQERNHLGEDWWHENQWSEFFSGAIGKNVVNPKLYIYIYHVTHLGHTNEYMHMYVYMYSLYVYMFCVL